MFDAWLPCAGAAVAPGVAEVDMKFKLLRPNTE